MIKYRVWDNKCNIYLNLVGAEIGNRNTKFCGFKYVYLKPQNKEVKMQNPIPRYGGCVGFKLTDSADADRLIFEQYTGLKDKNGVDIASGDIVKRRTANYEKQVFEDEYGVVKYEKGSFYVDFRGNRDNLMLRYGEPEVIGNIHENTEFLEEK